MKTLVRFNEELYLCKFDSDEEFMEDIVNQVNRGRYFDEAYNYTDIKKHAEHIASFTDDMELIK